jgi:hypothetical protein
MGEPIGTEFVLYDFNFGILKKEIGSVSVITTPSISSSVNYYLESVNTLTGCTSAIAPISLNVVPLPSAPNALDIVRCGAGSVTFTVDVPDGSTIRLYDTNGINRQVLATDNSAPYHLSVPFWSATHTFYLERETRVSNCTSALQPVRLVVNPLPAPPIVSNVARCGSGAVVFSPQMGLPAGNQILIYGAEQGGQPLGSAFSAPYELPSSEVSNTYNFYLSSVNSETGCESPRAPALAIIHPIPTNPIVSNVSRCGIGEVTFTITLEDPIVDKVVLFNSANSLSPVTESSSKPYLLKTPLLLANQTFWVAAKSAEGCFSDFVPVVANVSTPPSPPLVNTVERCGAGLATLTFRMGSPAGNQILLFTQESDLEPFITLAHAPYTAPIVVNETKVIYAQAYNSNLGCVSSKIPVTIKVLPIPSRPEILTNSPVCTGNALEFNILAPNPQESYLWTGPDNWQKVGGSVSRDITQLDLGGTYRVVAIAGSCTSEPAITNVEVKRGLPRPRAGAYHIYNDPTPLCEGSELNLEVMNLVEFPAGTHFTWRGTNQTTIATHPNPAFPNATPNQSGTYAVFGIYQGCTSAVDTVRVRIHPKPISPIPTGLTVFCEGSPAGLSLSILSLPPSGQEFYTYHWNGPNGFVATGLTINRTASPQNAGLYTVRAISSNGCVSEPTQITATIVPNITPPTISATTPLCMLENLILTATSNVTNAVYYWRGPNGFEFIGVTNPIRESMQLSDAGVYSASIIANGCTSKASAINVEVKRIPPRPVIFSNAPICTGDRLTLSTTAIPDAYYYWRGPCFEHSGADHSIFRDGFLANCSGLHSLTVVQNGCSSEVATQIIDIFNKPVIAASNDGPVCLGNEVTLTAQSQGSGFPPGTRFIWSGPNGFNVTTTSPTLSRVLNSPQDQGTYSVTVIVATNCTSAIQTTLVRTQAAPSLPMVVNDGPKCEGETLSFTVTGALGANYIWRGPNGFAATTGQNFITRNNVTSQDAGQYSVQMVVRGCTTAAQVSSVIIRHRPNLPFANASSPVCEGRNITLTASGVDPVVTYRWTGPGAFVRTTSENNIVIPNAQAGSYAYTLTAIVAGCTSLPAIATVEALRVPQAPNIIVDGIRKCVNDILQLNASITEEPATYIWSGPNGFSAVGSEVNKQALSAQESGYYQVFAIYQSCTTETSKIYINIGDRPASPIIRGNTPVCHGDRIQLTAVTGDSNYEFYWTGPGGFASTSAEINRPANIANAGAYSVTAINNGCSSSVAVRNIQVNPPIPLPEVLSNAPLCTGQNLELTVLGPPLNNARYEWSGPNNRVSTQFKPIFNNMRTSDAGTYTLIIRQNGCPSAPITIDVNVKPTPQTPVVTNSGPVCEGQNVNLEASGLSGAAYLWSGVQGFSSTLQSPTLTNVLSVQSGTYTARAIIQGCTSAAASTLVSIQPKPASPVTSGNTTICSGNALELTASPVSIVNGYQWEGPNGFYSTAQNIRIPNIGLNSSGTYTVRTFRGNCYSEPARVQVTVVTTPTPLVAGNNGPLCQGQALQLTASSFTGATYNWNGPGGFTSTEQNPVVNQPQTGTYQVKATLGACSSPIIETQVTILAAPISVQITNNSPVCSGENLQLDATYNPNWVYQWRGPNGFIHNESSITIQNASSRSNGIYTLIVTNGSCSSGLLLSEIVVRNNPLAPSISQNGPLCAGQALQLFASGSAGASYLWQGPGGFSSTEQNPIINNPVAGIYSLVSVLDGCSSLMTTENVIINAINCCPAPAGAYVETLSATVAKINWSNTLEGPLCYIVSWGPKTIEPGAWSSTQLVPYPQTSLVIENLDPSVEYGVQIRSNCTACAVRSGSRSSIIEATFRTGSARLQQSPDERISSTRLYPNPNTGSFILQLEANFSGKAEISILDINARSVFTDSVYFNEGENHFPMELRNLPPGIYMFELVYGEKKETTKLIIAR